MFTFSERKEQRKRHYENYVKGWKLRTCLSCNGSGYYDHDGSPDCGFCEGTGKERHKPQTSSESSIKKIQSIGRIIRNSQFGDPVTIYYG